MMKNHFCIALLLLAFCSTPVAEARETTQSPEPSLELTLFWIKEKIALYRNVMLDGTQGHSMTESYELTNANGCNLEISHVETDDDVKVSTVYQFPLYDYLSFNATNCTMFSLYTHGDSVTYTEQVERSGNKGETSNGVSDHVMIFTRRKNLDNCDMQRRFKNAFDHAAELCKGKGPKKHK